MKIKSIQFGKWAFFLSFFTTLALLTGSCRDEAEVEYKDVNVVFKVNATAGTRINAIVTQIGTAQTSNYTTAPTTTSWTSNGTVVNTQQGAVHLSATATGVNADSELTVSILVNDKVVNTTTIKGIELVAKTSIQFQNVFVNN